MKTLFLTAFMALNLFAIEPNQTPGNHIVKTSAETERRANESTQYSLQEVGEYLYGLVFGNSDKAAVNDSSRDQNKAAATYQDPKGNCDVSQLSFDAYGGVVKPRCPNGEIYVSPY